MKSKKTVLFILLLLSLSLLLLSFKKERREKEEQNIIKIGVMWSDSDPSVFSAAQIAIDEINKKGITILERGGEEVHYRAEPVFIYEDYTTENLSPERRVSESKKSALKVALDRDVVAVIGHYTSETALPATIIYETHNKLFLGTGSTTPPLTEHGFKKVFRMIPSDRDIALNISGFLEERFFRKQIETELDETEFEEIQNHFFLLKTAHRELIKKSYIKNQKGSYLLKEDITKENRELIARLLSYIEKDNYAVIVSEQSPYGRSLTKEITARAGEQYINLLPSLYYTPGKNEFHSVINSLRRGKAKAVIFSGQYDGAISFVQAAEKSGLKIPIIGGDSFINNELLKMERGKIPIFFTDFFDENSVREKFIVFKNILKEKELTPDIWNLKVYESMELLAWIMNHTRSKEPEILAEALRFMPPFKGISQDISFKENGDLKKPNIVIKTVTDEGFIPVRSKKNFKVSKGF